MARKTKDVTITAEGRDKGKKFRITEMPAARIENWAARAFMLILATGAPVSDEAVQMGAVGLTSIDIQGALGRIAYDDMRPLFDEMMECVQVLETIPDSPPYARSIEEDRDDIEEVATRLFLRAEVIEVHLGFSVTAALSSLGAAMKDKFLSSTTPTSPAPSEPA